MKVVVLKGGTSPERAVSLCSGERIARALREGGEAVTEIDWQGGLSADLLAQCTAADAVFLALHGGEGENGTLQSLLDGAGVHHYTGSDAPGAALAADKLRAKTAVAAFGVPVAEGVMLSEGEKDPPMPYPFVVKPREGGSSLGFSVIRSRADWRKRQAVQVL